MGRLLRWGRWLCALAALALAALLPAAAPAVDACHTERKAGAQRGSSTARARAPYIIGDSTMLLATPYLGRSGIEADARGCRQMSAGIQMLAARRRSGTLPNVDILALGANGALNSGDISRALSTIGRERILGLVTPRNSASSASAMRGAAHAHPHRVLLIDWVGYSSAHPSWVVGDGLHVGDPGARGFARLVRGKLEPFIGPPRSLKVPGGVGDGAACGQVKRDGAALNVFVIRGSDRLSCSRARHLVRLGTLRRIPNWRPYDFLRTGRKPWSDIYVRHDRKIIVASRRP
ncbi:MAG: hypothetical protein QOG15_681 [Solirubrobacteraceae bacterium]|jgi:hypothetical protein|nr:hypothetical protein [Solirubrobacteraceae bacterium]